MRGFLLSLISILMVVIAYPRGVKADYTPQPAVIIHGRLGQASHSNAIADFLRERGIPVYRYSFNDNEGSVYQWGNELGRRGHFNPAPGMDGLTWMERAQQDYLAEFGLVFGKARLVGFSNGGLAAREYATRDYYRWDVERIITTNCPNLGGEAALVREIILNVPAFATLGISLMVLGTDIAMVNPPLGGLIIAQGVGAIGTAAGAAALDIAMPLCKQGRFDDDAFADAEPCSEFLGELDSRRFPPTIRFSVIAGSGTPTFGKQSMVDLVGPEVLGDALCQGGGFKIIEDFFQQELKSPANWLCLGIPILLAFSDREDGDGIFVVDSQLGGQLSISRARAEVVEGIPHNLEPGKQKEAILRALDDPPILKGNSIRFPTPDWVLGYNTDDHWQFLEGTVSDYLPKKITVNAVTDGNAS